MTALPHHPITDTRGGQRGPPGLTSRHTSHVTQKKRGTVDRVFRIESTQKMCLNFYCHSLALNQNWLPLEQPQGQLPATGVWWDTWQPDPRRGGKTRQRESGHIPQPCRGEGTLCSHFLTPINLKSPKDFELFSKKTKNGSLVLQLCFSLPAEVTGSGVVVGASPGGGGSGLLAAEAASEVREGIWQVKRQPA